MKYWTKVLLQSVLGFHLYLVVHSIFVAFTMRVRKHEGDFLAFMQLLPANAQILDIGANVGTMTLMFARRCPQGKVFAFEPIADNFNAACTVLRLFRVKNATLFNLGVSDRAEILSMVMPRQGKRVRMEGTCHVVREPGVDDLGGLPYKAHFVALDEFAAIEGMQIDAIKIDVEDHEQFVLRGALRIIERDRPLIYCELWGATNKAESFRMLEALGYTAFVAVRGALEHYDKALHRQINFVFLPSSTVRDAGFGQSAPAVTRSIAESHRQNVHHGP